MATTADREWRAAEEGGVLAAYEAKVAEGAVRRDAAQVAVAAALDDVLHDLQAAAGSGLAPFLRRRLGRAKAVRGLYIWGDVGRGKSMLMDIFFRHVPLRAKRRVHFADFMADTHRRIGRLRADGADEPVAEAAAAIADEARVLCFDEFAVTDIADAMILSRLFADIFSAGVTLVATSNVAPASLYEGGLNRALFLPFIRLLRSYVDVMELGSGADYRLERLEDRRVYFLEGDGGFERLWSALLGTRDAASDAVPVGSRSVAVPRAAGGLARFTFAELCEAPLSAADHVALAKRYHTIFLEGVPVLTPAEREATRRLINFIDAAYEQKVRLVMSASAEPKELFDPGEGGAREEAFAFRRAASRLYEMRSASYLNAIETPTLG